MVFVEEECYFYEMGIFLRAAKPKFNLGLGCTDELERHVNTPPNFLAINGSLVNLMRSFPEGRKFIDRYMNPLISSPFAMQ